jgi:high-affinity iron transporter
MLAALLIVFREVVEAGLIIGIVLAATRGIAGRGIWIAGGVGAGVLGAALVAVFAGALSDAFSGSGQEIFNAAILLIAVVMLGWHNIWMARHGREVAQQMKAMGEAVAVGTRSLLALAIVVTTAVLREGAEVVLFLYGIAASSNEGWPALLLGGVLGIACGAMVSWLL